MGAVKPTVQIDWINDDSAAKYTVPSAGAQLAGHISDTAADPKIFNWVHWRVSQWVEFINTTFDSNGNNINAAKSTTITETVSPANSTVTLDAGGIKSWDASSNAIFSVTEPGVVTIGYSGNDIISLTAGVLSVATATAADLVKLHALTPSAADLNHLLGANGNGLVAADITKLAALTPSALDLNHLTGANGNGLVAADITKLAAIDSSAAELNLLNSVSGLVKADFTKLAAMTSSALDINTLLGANGNGLIVADLTKLANIDASDTEIDQLDGVTVGGTSAGDIVTIDGTQILTAKTLTSPKINEDVVLVATSTEIDAVVAASTANAIIGDGTPGRILRKSKLQIEAGTISGIKCTLTNIWNGDATSVDDLDKNETSGNFNLNAAGDVLTILNTGLTGNCVAVSGVNIIRNTNEDHIRGSGFASTGLKIEITPANSVGTTDLTGFFGTIKYITMYITYLTDA